MTTDTRDQDSAPRFERDLETVRSAWAGMEQSEPPDLLDQAVLNKARLELGKQRKLRPLRWLGAFATAAVVVLALTIVIQQDEQPLRPGMEKAESIMLDEITPAPGKKETDQDGPVLKVGRSQAAREIDAQGGERAEARMNQPAAAPAVQVSEDLSNVSAASTVEEETPAPAAEQKQRSDRMSEADAWIGRLLHLRDTQQDEEFALELAAFREAYPHYTLPPELRD